ncbi:MAG: hypothetical protein KH282_01860 [Clostridiales bacterium]|nr:hypothetical protein [Clostridiales bacterium]
MGQDIKIPIKNLLQRSVLKNMASYAEDEFNLLRRYYIACLNLGYFKPKDLSDMIEKFTSTIKMINTDSTGLHLLDSYCVEPPVLYINGELKYKNPRSYEINFFKAVSEVIFHINSTHIGFSSGICEMAAEKIYTMDTEDLRIIIPKTIIEKVGNKIIEIRAGYENYNLVISCLKQLFICCSINENKVIRDMYFNGYDIVLSKLLADDLQFKNSEALISLLDDICIMYIQRMTDKEPHPKELETLHVYQRFVNKLFDKHRDNNYLAFLALVTEDDLRDEFISNANS